MKKVLTYVLSMVMVAALAIGGTLAYLQDEDSDVNVMTMGNVDIEQFEYQRAEGVGHKNSKDNPAKEGDLIPFVQGQALYPAVPKGENPYYAETELTDLFWWGEYNGGNGGNGLWDDAKLGNVMDKFVFVKNVGLSDAYFRTVIAFECPENTEVKDGADIIYNVNAGYEETLKNADGESVYITLDGVRYYVMTLTYGDWNNGVLKPGETARPSLLQIVMNHKLGNEDVVKYGNTYDVLVLSQAVQTNGFDNASQALDTAFGVLNTENAMNWFEGTKIPTVKSEEGVNYITEGDTATINSNGGDTVYRGVYSDGDKKVTSVKVNEGITRLDNRAFCKNPSLTSVELPDSLTYIDEGVFQQSGFTTIEIPENVTYIGKTAFGACPDLEKIVIKSKTVTFANYVGRDNGKLKEVYIYSDSVTFEPGGSMFFTNAQTGDASKITFYVANQEVADALYNSSSATRSYGMLIKSIDGATTYYNTLK